jgi:ADYC domain
MRKTLLILALVCGCLPATHEPPADDTEQAIGRLGDKCPSHICGLNSGDLSDGGFFYDLNLDGLANADAYALDVVNGRLVATSLGLAAPAVLTGVTLTGTQLRIKKLLATGAPSYRTLTIQSVAHTTDFWAKRLDGAPTPKIETYKFHVGTDSGFGALLCQNGAEFVDLSSPVRAMSAHHGLVFEGERINITTLSIGPFLNSRWFNIGCAETALAKLHLTGHTKASQAAGFSNSIPERQTMLKMLTADYCGTGNSFTVSGQPLRWTDDDGTMTIASSVPRVLEARWTPAGASCLNTPRVLAHPTAASAEAFPDVELQIMDECVRPPPCPMWSVLHHLTSWNPISN